MKRARWNYGMAFEAQVAFAVHSRTNKGPECVISHFYEAGEDAGLFCISPLLVEAGD